MGWIMNWLCATLLICGSFNSVMDYTNNKEFVEDVTQCALHLNSLHHEFERVPLNIILSQAIHESEWGRSRFSTEGNNLMGIRTFDSSDDQLKPIDKPNVSWGLRVFETKCESISYYITLLNESHHYKDFREERNKQIVEDRLNSAILIKTLAIYAEDVYYTKKIIKIMEELEIYE
jgi:uncharacterized FlgJ-related protein